MNNDKFLICGEGIYNKNCPCYPTLDSARKDLLHYAKTREQSWLLFSIYKEMEDGSLKLVA